jgi:hypothetical protein
MNNKTVYNMSDQSNLDDPIIDYSITGPGWKTFASIDSELFETEQARCLEVATQAIEKFAKNWVNAIKENKDRIFHDDIVNYDEFLNS